MKTRYGSGDPKAAAVDLMRCFPGSFINQRLELIVHPRTNQYFLPEDFYKIYQHLGNAVNHEKTMRFVRSDFDMQELEVSYGAAESV